LPLPCPPAILWRMILGLDDIPGGAGFVSFLIWLGLSGLFYLVCYQAALNVIDDITKNSVTKIPVMLAAAVPSAGLMAVLNYKPLILFIITIVSNYFRIKSLSQPGSKKLSGLQINKPLFYFASYSYLSLVLALALYFQSEEFLKVLGS
jgi:hypothetical protein